MAEKNLPPPYFVEISRSGFLQCDQEIGTDLKMGHRAPITKGGNKYPREVSEQHS